LLSFAHLIRQRLKELGADQRDLAGAAQVTDSFISQLLSGRKPPPASERTDIYGRMEEFLRVPAGTLATLADLQRTEAARRRLGEPPAPLLKEVRALVVAKCRPATRPAVRAAFEKEAFGDLERLVTRKLLDLVKRVVSEELKDEQAVAMVARLSGRSYEQVRVTELEFLQTDVFTVTAEHCETFLGPLIDEWDIDLTTFAMEVILNARVAPGHRRRLEFVERQAGAVIEEEPGLRAFLDDPSLSGDATDEEIAFLQTLRFPRRRPTALYYYRELQSLRDPLHFRVPAAAASTGRPPASEGSGRRPATSRPG
jgi:transcriptional regulator with XRE-family HTH domain